MKKEMYIIGQHLNEELSKIAVECCKIFDITIEQLKDPRRDGAKPRARHLFFWLTKEIFGMTVTYSQMSAFLKKDHSTALHGIRKTKEAMDAYPRDRDRFNTLLSELYKVIIVRESDKPKPVISVKVDLPTIRVSKKVLKMKRLKLAKGIK